MADANKAQSDKDLDRFFIEDPNDLPEEEQEETTETGTDTDGAEEQPPETQGEAPDTAPEEAPKDKFEGKTFDELKQSYTNLEAMMGKMGQELGELRKKVSNGAGEDKREYTAADIPTMPDGDLDYAITQHEAYLLTPDKAIIDAENFPAINVQYNKLMAEKAKRDALRITKSGNVAQANTAVVNGYAGKDVVTATELDAIKEYALKRLSDNGEITTEDLDVAMHKLFPGKWAKFTADKDKLRIARAKTEATPRITPNSPGTTDGKLKTLDEINKMSPLQYEAYIDTLNPAQLKELKDKINKG